MREKEIAMFVVVVYAKYVLVNYDCRNDRVVIERIKTTEKKRL